MSANKSRFDKNRVTKNSKNNNSTNKGSKNKDSTNKKVSSHWGTTIFGLFFLLPAIVLLVMGPLDTLRIHFMTSTWDQVPAQLNDIQVESHYGDDSTTYSLSSSYTYQYFGTSYKGSRVGYDTSNDNIGDWHSETASDIRRAASSGQLTVWVNGDNPSESYLVRDVRLYKMFFTLIFVLVFGGVGVGVMLFGLHSSKKATHDNGIVYSGQNYTHWVLGFMAFIFTAISLPAVLAIPSEMASGNPAILVVIVFPLIGAGLGFGAYKSLKNWRYYGPTPLLMNPCPGKNNGQVGGEITIAHSSLRANWSVTLQCIRKVQGSGKNSSSRESVLWQRKTTPEIREVGNKTLVRFVFEPDENLPASYRKGRTSVFWRLTLVGPQAPVKLERHFVLPVEEGTTQSTLALSEAHVQQVTKEELVDARESMNSQLDIQEKNGEMYIASDAGRNLSMSLGMAFMGFVFSGVGIFLFHQAAKEGVMLYFMGVVFSLFGVPMVMGGIFMLGRSLETTISDGIVHTKRAWFGRALWRRKVSFNSADQIILKKSGSMTSGTKTTEFFNVDLKDASGASRKVRIAEGLDNREAGELLVERLKALLVSDELF